MFHLFFKNKAIYIRLFIVNLSMAKQKQKQKLKKLKKLKNKQFGQLRREQNEPSI